MFATNVSSFKYFQQTRNKRKIFATNGKFVERFFSWGPPPSLPIKKEAKKQPPAIAVSGSGHTRKQSNSFDAVIHVQESPPHKRFLRVVGCNSNFMRLAQHLTALRAWCKQCVSGRWKKLDMLRSQRCRGARVYGHTTTARHDLKNLEMKNIPVGWDLFMYEARWKTKQKLLFTWFHSITPDLRLPRSRKWYVVGYRILFFRALSPYR